MAAEKPPTPKTSSKGDKKKAKAADRSSSPESPRDGSGPETSEFAERPTTDSPDDAAGESSMIETLLNTVIETWRQTTGNGNDRDDDTTSDTTSDTVPPTSEASNDDDSNDESGAVPPIPVRTPYVVVVTGNAPLDNDAVARVPDSAIVLAADGGLDFALASGLRPAALIGDLDSVSPAGLAWAETNANVQRFPADKDQTDTELALAVAADFNPDHLILLGGDGDRLDHTITALGALGQGTLASVPMIEAWWGDQHLFVVQGPGRVTIATTPGMTVSVVATHGPCEGVTIEGVRWPLMRADLAPLSGLGVSNEATSDAVEIAVSSGVLTVFLPPVIVHRDSPR